jgi:predicted GH43/DUF377 family glycosyl hydrolase
MKSLTFTLCLLTILLMSGIDLLLAQSDPAGTGPVLDTGLAGSWDDGHVEGSTVIYDSTNSTFKMWYSGGYDESHINIGYATSDDGINWEKYEHNPVLTGDSLGGWDAAVIFPSVAFEDGVYHMWYTGARSTDTCQIGYATSPDGINWTKDQNNPVLKIGVAGSWEDRWVISPCVRILGSKFHMWYTGAHGNPTGADYSEQIGYATSNDGIIWEKYLANPVLAKGNTGQWDARLATCPSIFYNGKIFEMWYSGQSLNTVFRIGYATSPDGIVWQRYAANPVMSPTAWENPRVQNPYVLLIDSTYQMWYSGGDYMSWQIGYAWSQDGISWIKNQKPVLTDIKEQNTNFPAIFELSQNYPNPFNPSTTIEFTLPSPEYTTLKVYNILGKEISTIVAKKLNQGNYTYIFDGKNLASGIYYYQLVAGDYREVKKMILIR